MGASQGSVLFVLFVLFVFVCFTPHIFKSNVAGIPCGPLVVPNSGHKDGHNKNSKTFDEVSVICDGGYVNKNNGNLGATAACAPTNRYGLTYPTAKVSLVATILTCYC